jgi:hypothetical protein
LILPIIPAAPPVIHIPAEIIAPVPMIRGSRHRYEYIKGDYQHRYDAHSQY